MGADSTDIFYFISLGPDLTKKVYAITGLNSFNFLLQVNISNINFRLHYLL